MAQTGNSFSFIVPEKITTPDPITQATKRRFQLKRRHWHDEFIENEISDIGSFHFEGSKEQFPRALRIIDTLVKALKQKEYKFRFSNSGSIVVIEGMEIELRFREKNKRVRIKTNFGHENILKPTGFLSLKVHHDLSKKEWSGTVRTPLEEKVADLIQRLELFAKEERKEQEALEKYWEEQRIIEEKEIRIRQKRELELQKFKELLAKSERWHQTNQLRKFVKAMEDEAVLKEKVTDEFNQFLSWAVQKIDWYDPFLEREDNVFEKVNRETLELKSRWG